MDAFVQSHYSGLHYDKDAAIASAGKVHQGYSTDFQIHRFFHKLYQKQQALRCLI
jgi:anhydro-N-acetylmuramic acid kinase